jgi:hypothetical protein
MYACADLHFSCTRKRVQFPIEFEEWANNVKHQTLCPLRNELSNRILGFGRNPSSVPASFDIARASSGPIVCSVGDEEVAGQSDAKLGTISQGPHRSMPWG